MVKWNYGGCPHGGKEGCDKNEEQGHIYRASDQERNEAWAQWSCGAEGTSAKRKCADGMRKTRVGTLKTQVSWGGGLLTRQPEWCVVAHRSRDQPRDDR